MYLTVTIDTEEDNWGEYGRSSYTVENIGRIPRLQQLFMKRGIRPTYLISYPVATHPAAVEILGSYREQGLCEIGTHPHPWNTPPVTEEPTARNSFLSNLPSTLQFEKIRTLTNAIAKHFGIRPTSYRSGRWGFNDDIAGHLIRLGYTVDTSILPASNWSSSGGPDFSHRTHAPFVYQLNQRAGTGGGALLEVPPTVDYLQSRRALANAVFQSITGLPLGQRLAAVLNKLGLVNCVSISPEIALAPAMMRLTRALLERGTTVINMFFHSPTLLERCSPFAATAADVAAFVERIDAFLAFTQSAGLQSVTMSELTAARVGASSARVLPISGHAVTA